MDQPPQEKIELHKLTSNDEVLVNDSDKEMHWNVLDRIKRKFEEDLHLRKIFSCLNHYNFKNKKNPITFILIIEYMRKDDDGNRLALADRYKFTLFSSSRPKYTTNLDGGKTSEKPIHIQLLVGRITGYETNDKLEHIMSDLSAMPIPGTKMYKKVESSGLFAGNVCYTGLIGGETTYKPIPDNFLKLR